MPWVQRFPQFSPSIPPSRKTRLLFREGLQICQLRPRPGIGNRRVAQSVEFLPRVRGFAVTRMNTFSSNRHRPLPAPVTLSAHRFTILGNAGSGSHEGAHMQKIKLFADYSVPVVWFV